MHGSPISHVDAGRKSAGNGHPTDGNGLRPARRSGRAPQFGPESALDECPQGLSQFSRPLLGCDEQVIGEINGCLHLGRRIPVFAERPLSDGNGAKKADLPSFSGWRLLGAGRRRRVATAGAT